MWKLIIAWEGKAWTVLGNRDPEVLIRTRDSNIKHAKTPIRWTAITRDRSRA